MFVVLSATVLSQEAPFMSASEEEGSLGLEFGSTESDSVSDVEEKESSAGSKSSGKTVLEGGNRRSSAAHEEGGCQGQETDYRPEGSRHGQGRGAGSSNCIPVLWNNSVQ